MSLLIAYFAQQVQNSTTNDGSNGRDFRSNLVNAFEQVEMDSTSSVELFSSALESVTSVPQELSHDAKVRY